MSVKNSKNQPVIAMIAGEASGDQLGSGLISALKKRYPDAQFVGIGGPKMIAEGFVSWFPIEKLSVMGFFEVLKHLKELLSIRKQLIDKLLHIQPDVVVGIDAPDFNFKVEEKMKQHGITTIHYVGPSVWAWREKRLNKIKHQVDGVLVLFPFEEPLYRKYHIPVQFVGHPLANQIPASPNSNEARRLLNLPETASLTGIMPGSRMSEIQQMTPIYLQAAKLLSAEFPEMEYAIPCVHEKAMMEIKSFVKLIVPDLKVHLFLQQADKVIESSDQLMVTSGTATLQVALYQKPLLLAIKVHPISYFIMKRLATTRWIGLPNILAQETLVTELIQADAIPEKVANELRRLICDEAFRQQQIKAFKSQYSLLHQNASERAADAIEEWGLSR